MNSVAILTLVGLMASTAYGLKCQTCTHQTFDADDAKSKEMSEEIGMWNEDCLKAKTGAGTDCTEAGEGKASFCYTVAVETSEFAYKSNLTGTEEDVKMKAQLYRRGCAALSNETDAGTITDKDKLNGFKDDFTNGFPAENTGTYKEFEGTLMLCNDKDDCNKNKIDEVSGSAALVASVSLIVGIAAAWIVGSQA